MDITWLCLLTGRCWWQTGSVIITSLTGAVAKYCDEYVCVCVCVSVRDDISGTTGAIFTNFVYVAYGRGVGGPPAAEWWNSKEGSILEVFFSTDSALYSIAFGTHTKTAEPMQMPFRLGWWVSLSEEQYVTWGWRYRRGRGSFGEKHLLDKPNTPNNCELDWSMQRYTIGAEAWLQALDIYDCFVQKSKHIELCLLLQCYLHHSLAGVMFLTHACLSACLFVCLFVNSTVTGGFS